MYKCIYTNLNDLSRKSDKSLFRKSDKSLFPCAKNYTILHFCKSMPRALRACIHF